MSFAYSHKIFLICIAFLLFACNRENENAVASVNDYPVTTSELKYWMMLQRAEVYNYYYTEYGINDSDTFWVQKINNESPLEKLKDLAFEKAVRCKIQQILAFEKDLVEEINFDRIISGMKEENKRRKQKVENSGVIYGQIEFTERTYFAHEFDKMILKLKPELLKEELIPTEEDLKSMVSNADFSLEDNYGFYQMQYVEENYEKYIDELIKNADIEINKNKWDAIDAEFN